MVGATYFQRFLVALASFWYCLLLVLFLAWVLTSDEIVPVAFYAVVWNGLFAYPHLVLLTELQVGVIHPFTYHTREQHLCSFY